MNWRDYLRPSVAALVSLIAWWGGVTFIDGYLAQNLPYNQYSMVALLYPDIYYPGLPGWVLAHAQPFAAGLWVVTLGWLVLLSGGIGAGALKLPADRALAPTKNAIAIVVGLFAVATIIEAIVTLVA